MNPIYLLPLDVLLVLLEALLEQTDLTIQERAQFQSLLDALRSEAALCHRRPS